MSTPTSRAGYLRGGLVGGCSAMVTSLAHSMAGGGVPVGGALVLLFVVCATLGVAVGGISLHGRNARLGLVVVALCVGQALGHVVLTIAAGDHGDCGWMLTAPMLSVHAAAAVGLGAAISVVEYLYVVSATVLCWLRLFTTSQIRPTIRPGRRRSNVIVVLPVLLRAGLGMRAPPPVSFAGV